MPDNRNGIRKGAFVTSDGPRLALPEAAPSRRAKAQTVHKGQFMTVDCVADPNARRARAEERELREKFPEFEASLKAAGARYGVAFEKHQAAIRELATRFEAVRAQVETYNNKRKR